MRGPAWFLVALAVLWVATASLIDNQIPDGAYKRDAWSDLDRSIDALHRALRFMQGNLQDLNLDAIIGTRIVSGQLRVLLGHHMKGVIQTDPMIADVLSQIASLQLLAQNISDEGELVVKKTEPKYFYKIGPILADGFWELDYPSRQVAISMIGLPTVDDEAISETESDDCLAELFNTGSVTASAGRCNITERCWNAMTSPGYKLYSLTHEVFYLEIGEQYGCMSGMEVLARAHNHNTVDGLHRRFCADVYRDAVRIYKQGAPDGTQDLFMEQAALCGMLGFRDFARPEWLDGILSWQHRSGCYKIQDYSHIFEDYLTKEVAAANRVKREEAVLAGYCLAHKTTVAAGALSQHIRYLLETLTSA